MGGVYPMFSMGDVPQVHRSDRAMRLAYIDDQKRCKSGLAKLSYTPNILNELKTTTPWDQGAA